MNHDDLVHRYLAGLPDPALPPGLWPRLQSAWQRQRHRRRHRVFAFGLAAAAVLTLAVIPLAHRGGPDPVAPPPATPDLAQASLGNAASLAEVRALDRALQAAYSRGAGDAEITMLWQAREAAMARLKRTDQTLPQPLRI